MASPMVLGISKKKLTGMMFLLFVVLISLALSNVSFLVSKSISVLPSYDETK